MFRGRSGALDERYEETSSYTPGSQTHLRRCLPIQVLSSPVWPWYWFTVICYPGRYTVRFSPAERQVIENGVVSVIRAEGREISLDERAVSCQSIQR